MILDNQIFLDPQQQHLIDRSESARKAPFATMPKKKATDPIEGQAERLKRLRELLRYDTSAAFAVWLGTSAQRYNHYENGKPLSREIAFRLVQKVPGLTLDWLYFGKPDGLTMELARRLGELGAPGKRTTA